MDFIDVEYIPGFYIFDNCFGHPAYDHVFSKKL